MRVLPLLLAASASSIVFFLASSCSLGEGQGTISGSLNVPSCWSGRFELKPDFYAGVPYRQTSLDLRIQEGGDFQTFSDGLSILIDDVHAVRPDNGPGHLNESLRVSLPPEVTPPGVPIKALADPTSVHMALYLQRTCRTHNVVLYALDEVTLNADGTCDAIDGADFPIACAPAAADAGPDAAPAPAPAAPLPTARSTITFKHLFNGNPDETVAAERLTEASFAVYLADPRDVCPGGLGPPARCRGRLSGSVKFYFQRGRPGQPFP